MAKRGVLFGCNALVVLIMMLGHMDPIGALRVVAILAVAGYFLVYRKRTNFVCVMEDIAVYVCVDLIAYIALWFDQMSAAFNGEAINTAFTKVAPENFGALLLIGIPFLIVGFVWKPWLLGIGGGICGSTLVLGVFATGELKNIVFAGNGRTIFTVYVFSAAFWTLCLFMSELLNPKRKILYKVLGAIVFCASVYIAICCSAYTDAVAPQIAKDMLALPEESFAWWRVLVCAIVLGGMAYVLSERNVNGDVRFGIDSIVLVGCIVLVVGVRVLMDHYFVFSWVFMLALVVVVCRCIANAKSGQKTFGLKALPCLGVALIAFIVISSLLGSGLLPSAIVTCVLLVAVYVFRDKMKGYLADGTIWVCLVVALVIEVIAWLGIRHNLISEYVKMALILAFGIATLWILNRRRDGGVLAPRKWDIVVCCCVGLLCVVSLRTTVTAKTESTVDDVKTTLAAAKDSNPITKATYQWVNSFGEVVAPEAPLPSGESKLPIQADHLIVRATDSAGATIRYDYFYASWKHRFEEARKRVADAAAKAEAAKAEAAKAEAAKAEAQPKS